LTVSGMDACPTCHAMRPYWAFAAPGGPCADCRGHLFTVAEVVAILERDRQKRTTRPPDKRPREGED
jgi:hypothetical protein